MRARSAYRQALAAQDAVAFYVNVLVEALFLLAGCGSDKGWHRVINYSIVVPVAMGLLYTFLVRTVEVHWPARYARWRPILIRGERYYITMVETGDIMLVSQLHTQGAITPARVGRAFTYHHWRASPTWNSCRLLCLAAGGIGAIPSWVRPLPFVEQAALQAVLLANLLLFTAQPAAQVLSMPQAHEGNRRLCKILIALPYSDFHFPGACASPETARRLVLFTFIYLFFLVPVALSFRHGQYLHRLQQLDDVRQLAQYNGVEYQPPLEEDPWWNRYAVTGGLLLYLALVTWRFLLDYDQHVFEAIARAQVSVVPVAAKLWPYLSLRVLRA